jgi:hypothetical protein
MVEMVRMENSFVLFVELVVIVVIVLVVMLFVIVRTSQLIVRIVVMIADQPMKLMVQKLVMVIVTKLEMDLTIVGTMKQENSNLSVVVHLNFGIPAHLLLIVHPKEAMELGTTKKTSMLGTRIEFLRMPIVTWILKFFSVGMYIYVYYIAVEHRKMRKKWK